MSEEDGPLFDDDDFVGAEYVDIDSRFFDMCDEMMLSSRERLFLEGLLCANLRNYVVDYKKLTHIYTSRTSFNRMLKGLEDKGLIELSKNGESKTVVCMDKLKKAIQSRKTVEQK